MTETYKNTALWKIRNRMFDDIEAAVKNFGMAGNIDRNKYDSCQCSTVMEATFCQTGHMLECHYPMTCSQARCIHYEKEADSE